MRLEPTDDAKCLLAAAASGRNNIISHVRVIGREDIAAGGKTFTDNSRRSIERWLAALRELERLELVENRGGEETYYVTHQGFQVADGLNTAEDGTA